MVVLGGNPQDLTLQLAYDSDFNTVLESYNNGQPEDFPAGTEVTLEVKVENTTTVWTATVSGNQATFNVDAAAVNAVLDQAGQRSARLFYENGTDRRLWASGKVKEVR